jgi:hypothetical protein
MRTALTSLKRRASSAKLSGADRLVPGISCIARESRQRLLREEIMALELEATAMRKVALRFLPLLGLCYTINVLDRFNVSIAALTMNKALGLSATTYGLGAGNTLRGGGRPHMENWGFLREKRRQRSAGNYVLSSRGQWLNCLD